MLFKKNIFTNFLEIWRLLKIIRKIQIAFLFVLSLFSGFFEVISIGAIMPFIDILLDPRSVTKYLDYLSFLNFSFLEINKYSDYEIKLFVTIVFVITIILSSIFRFILYFLNIKIAYLADFDFKNYIFEKINYSRLNFRKTLNINETLANFEKIKNVYKSLHSILLIFCYLIFSTLIILSLFYIDPYIISLLGIFTLIYYTTINLLTKKFIQIQSKKNALSVNKSFKILNYSFNYYKNIILDKLNKFYTKNFKIALFDLASTNIKTKWITALASNFFITILFIFIAIIIFQLSADNNFTSYLPKVIAISFGAQRLITSLNSIFSNYQKILFLQEPLFDAIAFIKKVKRANKETITKRKNINVKDFQEIRLNNISYKINKKTLFKNLNLLIKSQDKILISGKTGSGKTSLVEIISGLNYNFHGDITLNKKKINKDKLENLRDFFSIVPQEIFIFETTILDNIVNKTSNNKVDSDKLRLAIKCAELEKFVNNKKNKLDYVLALDGQNMSGGQKQRIGIARALYKNTPVIIFDEATNALDEKTESKIYKNIKKYYNDKTFLCISHNNKVSNFFNKRVKI
tara:strand:+ start:648 stop:2375 length:1728 start_codon:yes stop_codon:yes gene_type:complete